MTRTTRRLIAGVIGCAVAFALMLMLRHRPVEADVSALAGHLEPRIASLCRESLAEHDGSWWCGPTCYALARRINAELFGGELPIVAEPHTGDNIRLVLGAVYRPDGERYSLTAHMWLEITAGPRLIFVDPTHGQYSPPDLLVQAFDGNDRSGYFEYLSRLGYADIGAMEGDPHIRCRVSLVKSGIEAVRVPDEWREWERMLNLEAP